MKFIKVHILIILVCLIDSTVNSPDAFRNFIRSRLQQYIMEVETVHGLISSQQHELGHGHDHDGNGHSRQKRTIIEPYNTIPGRRRRNITHIDFDGTNVVRRVFRLNPQPFDNKDLYDLNVLPIKRDNVYVFTIEKSEETGTQETVAYRVHGDLTTIEEVTRISTPEATRVEVFRIDYKYYVLPITATSPLTLGNIDVGSKLYQFDYTKHSLSKVQTIQTPNAQASHFWIGSGHEANDAHLAIAPGFTEKSPDQHVFKVDIPIYRWQGGYFDFVYAIPGYNPQSIKYASISTHEFLAVANYQDGPHSTVVHSEIFKFNHKVSKFMSFQKILTEGAKDIQYFSFDNGQRGEHFLVIANHGKYDAFGTFNYNVKSQILKFATERFIHFQSFTTFGAFQVLPVKSGKSFLIVLGEINRFCIRQYNGWKFVETVCVAYSDSNAPVNFIRLASFDFDNQPYFGVASSDTSKVSSGIFSLEFEQKAQLSTVHLNLEKWCRAAVTEMEATDITKLSEEFASAPKVGDREIVLQGDLTFASVKSNLVSTEALTLAGQRFDAQLSKEWASKERQLKELKQQAKDLEIQLGNVVRKNGNQDVATNVKFNKVVYAAPELKIYDLNTTLLNGIHVDNLFKKMIFLDQNYDFRYVNAETVRTNQMTFEKLNGLELNEYVVKSGSIASQVFTQDNTFNEKVTIETGFTVNGLLDGVDFKNVNFLFLHGNQNFSKAINVRDSTVNNLISSQVNDVSLEYYMNEAVLKSEQSATISGAKNFQSLDAKQLHAGKVSGVDIDKLYAEAIYLDSRTPQVFTSPSFTFDKLTTQNVQVQSGILNNKYNVKDLVLVQGGMYTFDSMELIEDTIISDLYVSRFLNTIRVLDDQLDIILKNSDTLQVVSNKKINEITLEQNAIAHDLLDGVNLTNWSAEKFIELNSNSYNFRNMKIDGYLTIPGIHIDFERRSGLSKFLVGLQDVGKLLSKSLLLSSTSLPSFFSGRITFESVDVFGDTVISSVNDVSPNTDWLLNTQNTRESTVVITGSKSFLKKLEFKDSIIANKGLFNTTDTFNEIDFIQAVKGLLLNQGDQEIFGSSRFAGLLTIDNLECPNVNLNGIPFGQLLLKTGNQAVSGKVLFEKPITVAEELSVHHGFEVDSLFIQGQYRNLLELKKDTLLTKSDDAQHIIGRFEVSDKLQIHRRLNWNPNKEVLIGGRNIRTLLSNIVRNDGVGLSNIYGSVTFKKSVTAERFEFAGTLNGISHLEWGESFLLTSGNQIISTPVRFQQGIHADEVTVTSNKISNIDFVKLANDALRIDDHGELGVVTFAGHVSTPNGLSLGDRETTVNGINIFTDLLLNNQKSTVTQIVTGSKTFVNGFHAHRNVDVAKVDGFDYKQAVAFVQQQTELEDSLYIHGNLVLEHEPEFTADFNGIEWQVLIEDIWWLNQPTKVSSEILFDKIILENGVSAVDGLVSGIDIRQLQEDYLSKSKDQTIRSKVLFEDGIKSAKLIQTENVTILNDGTINGVNLVQLLQTSLLNGVPQTLSTKFKFTEFKATTIEVDEGVSISEVDLGTDAVLLNGNNVITGKKTLQSLTITDTLKLGERTKLNGIDLQKWDSNAVRDLHQEISVKGDVTLNEGTFLHDVTALGTVDGITFNRETLFTKSGDQEIRGTFTFPEESFVLLSSDVGITADTYNGQNLTDLVESLVQINHEEESDEPLILSGSKTFVEVVHSESLVAEGTYQGQNITEILSTLTPEQFVMADYNASLTAEYNQLIAQAEELLELSNRRAMFLNYFELTSTVQNPNFFDFKALHMGATNVVSLVFLKKQLSSSSLSFLAFNHDTGVYEASRVSSIEVTGTFTDIAELHTSSGYFLLVAGSTNGETSAISVYKLTQSNSGLFTASSSHYQLTDSISGFNFDKLTTFQLHDSSETKYCFLAIDKGSTSNYGTSSVHCLDESTGKILRGQTLTTEEPATAVSVEFKRSTLLFVSSEEDTTSSTNVGANGAVVEVWLHSGRQFEKIDCLPVVNLVSMSAIVGPNNNSFLALASGQYQEHGGSVYLYRFVEATRKFVKVLYLPVTDPVQVEFQPLNHEALLYVMNSASFHNIQVYSFKGKSGWVKEHQFTSKNAQLIRATGFQIDSTLSAQLLVGSTENHTVNVFRGVFYGKRKRSTKKSNAKKAQSQAQDDISAKGILDLLTSTI